MIGLFWVDSKATLIVVASISLFFLAIDKMGKHRLVNNSRLVAVTNKELVESCRESFDFRDELQLHPDNNFFRARFELPERVNKD